MKKKAIAAGHICLDITPAFPDRKAERVSDALVPGQLLNVGPADVHTGGAVANTGLAMKSFGADVSLMGKVGNDAFGRMVLSALRECGADQGMICSETEATSYSVVLAIPGIDRIFLHNPGANDSFRADDIPLPALKEAALLHFGYPPLMRSMYEQDGAELVRLMRRANEAGAAASLDLAAVDANSAAGRVSWRRILERTLPYVDFFVPSAEELCFMLDPARFAEWQARAAGRDITDVLEPQTDIAPLAEECLRLGARVVLIKCGGPGMYFRSADRRTLERISPRLSLDASAWADRAWFEHSFVPERVLSGTGAGDASIAAFLTAVLEGRPPEQAVTLAAAAGACCVSAYDALSGLIPFEAMEKKIASGWARQGGEHTEGA